MSENIQIKDSDETSKLALVGHQLCIKLYNGDLDACIKILVQHAKNTGYQFSSPGLETTGLKSTEHN